MKDQLTGERRHMCKRTFFGKWLVVLQVEYEFVREVRSGVYADFISGTAWRNATPNDMIRIEK